MLKTKRAVCALSAGLIIISVVVGPLSAATVSWIAKDITTQPDEWFTSYGDNYWFFGSTFDPSSSGPIPTGFPNGGPSASSSAPPAWVDSFTVQTQTGDVPPPVGGGIVTPAPLDVLYRLTIGDDLPGGASIAFDFTILFYDVGYSGSGAVITVDGQEAQLVSQADSNGGAFFTWRIEAEAGEEIVSFLDLVNVPGEDQTFAAAFFVDDITFLPEPATLAIMGLGAITTALFKRRR